MGSTPLTDARVRALYTIATCWDGDGPAHLQESNRAEFDHWLAAHDAEVAARALEDMQRDYEGRAARARDESNYTLHATFSLVADAASKRAATIRAEVGK